MNLLRAAGVLGVAGAGVLLAPAPASLGAVRHAMPPWVGGPVLRGVSDTRHVALTFDDGPDTTSTPRFLACLEELDVRATFFVLGRHLGDGSLVREMSARGHEVGVHGWDHRAAVAHAPRRLADDVRRTRDLVEDLTGGPVVWYRPPYGLLTSASLWAARSAGLRTVLWSAWGRDWERGASASSVAALVSRQLSPGGTVLLHDSDRTSSPDSWRATLGATRLLVTRWQECGLDVGPLREHWAHAG